MIKAVLFDYGGVLSLGGKNFRGFLRGLLGVDELTDQTEQMVRDLGRGKITSQDFVARLNQDYGTSIDVEEVVGTHNFARSEGVYDLADELRKKGIKVGILSNTSDMNAQRLSEEGFYDGFDPVILSFDESFAKPDVELYEKAIAKVGVEPGCILFIDDQQRFLLPAQKLGMQTILAKSEEQIVADTKAMFKKENGLEL